MSGSGGNRCERQWATAHEPSTLRPMLDASLISATELASLEAAGLGALGTRLMQQLDHARLEIDWRDAKLQKLTLLTSC